MQKNISIGMQKIKILHIIKSLGRGGAEMLLPETLKVHDRDKFEFHYIYFLPWKDQMVQSISDAGGEVTCISASNNIQLLSQAPKVIRYCKNNHIDLIHCHLPWAGFLGRLVHLRTAIPLIYTEHSLQEQYHMVTKLLNRWTYNFQSMALGVSRDSTISIKKNINPRIKVSTLFNGVNTEAFQKNPEEVYKVKRKLGIPVDATVLGTVAVFRKPKRLVEWVNVFEAVSRKNDDIYGIIVGAGPLEESIKAEVKNLGLEQKLIFPGLQTEVKPFLSSIDIFMMTSSYEGLPIALLEAMSMECAVVSTDAGGIKEVIRDQQDGLTCKVDKWDKLSDLCQILIDDPEKLGNYKKAARERVVNNFSLKRMVDELESIYIDLVTK